MIEYIDELDSEDNIIRSRPKDDLKKTMFFHRVSLIIPKADENKIILSKRAADKFPFANTWCCAVGGRISTGETEEQAALREMQEEIGLQAELSKVVAFKYDAPEYKAFFTIFTTKQLINLQNFKLNPIEVQFSQDFFLADLKNLIEKNPNDFAPSFRVALKEFVNYF